MAKLFSQSLSRSLYQISVEVHGRLKEYTKYCCLLGNMEMEKGIHYLFLPALLILAISLNFVRLASRYRLLFAA